MFAIAFDMVVADLKNITVSRIMELILRLKHCSGNMILQHIGKRIPYAKNDIGWLEIPSVILGLSG